MGYSLLTNNHTALAGKWNPYIYKRFNLGTMGVANSSDDDEIYISQTTGTGSPAINAFISDSLNAGAVYNLVFSGTSDKFAVQKSFEGTVEDIAASQTGGSDDGRFWEPGSGRIVFTIDIGIYIHFPDVSSSHFSDGDVIRINTPSREVMERRKLYHGGFSTYMRMPETEGKAYHSDIIPMDLKGRNLSVFFGATFKEVSNQPGMIACTSAEDTLGNSAVSLSLEWNVNPDSATSSTAGETTYTWGSGETWQLGTVFANDVSATAGTDTPVFSSFPGSDVVPITTTTGTIQTLNTQVSGRAGHARIRTEYWSGSGSPKVTAFNQFWPVILTID